MAETWVLWQIPKGLPTAGASNSTPHGQVPQKGTSQWLSPEQLQLWGHSSIQEENPFLSPQGVTMRLEAGGQIQDRAGGDIRGRGWQCR